MIDGQNRRIGKRIDGVLTKAWLYKDQLKPVAELDGSGNLVARFIYGSKTNVPDVILRYATGTVTRYRVISDHLGSPVMAVNVDNPAEVPFAAEYSAFGEMTVTTGASSNDWMPFGFAGGLYDADTELVRFGARDYDAVVGRWVSKEPLRFVAGKNLYAYSWNDPIDLTDPSGLAPTDGGGGATGTGCGGAEGNSSTGDPLPQPSADSYKKDWCGTGWNENLVPDSMLGVDWSSACQAHDECYGTCGASQSQCDSALGQGVTSQCMQQSANMSVNIDSNGNGYMSGQLGVPLPCEAIGSTYQSAVSKKGASAFAAAQAQSRCQ